MTAKAERRVFFSIARVLCQILLGGALAAIAALGISLVAGKAAFPSGNAAPVSVATVLAAVPGTQSANDDFFNAQDSGIDVPNAMGIPIPKPLNTVLTSDTSSQSILNGWLGDIPVQGRRTFVDGLAAVVAAANQHAAAWEWDNRQHYVAAAMSEYARLTIERIAAMADARKQAAEKLETYREAFGTLLGVAATLTLLLTVLAIERNTRAAMIERARE
ncbi:hypothetical protein [Paraburkholderia kururiensis]|uniref:Uncharacterized protein n=1 Tax=Paraburkholderia kururiensis TaxID=984307 RepID=A0ABZ0WTI3_9BURK|nr:hypothetical protein [Paraburkholderia kururiensis]WQD80521.1 hypothetical protein U0042_13040 [Paraburkholderia kururiensis]